MSDIIKKNISIGLMAAKGDFRLEEVVEAVQSFCLGLRLEHWKTNSYALHKATEMIQGDLEGLLDSFVETAVGLANGSRPDFKKDICACTDENYLITCLKEMPARDSSLLNIRDEMVASLYKLKYLKSLK